VERQKREGWGTKVIDRLAEDLRHAFPEIKGFSARNLKYMRAFAEAWQDEDFVQQVAAQLPWFHNCVLLDKLKSNEERAWYSQLTIQNGWSRNVLVHQIESDLFHRQGRAITNFERTLPAQLRCIDVFDGTIFPASRCRGGFQWDDFRADGFLDEHECLSGRAISDNMAEP
jgi:DUF1016 N-terminal domain